MSNTAEAKPPSDESGWQAIDIYLFANGQQYSPPRKYHLTNDELNWWDSTLSSLAKSLYGVMHPYIVLYTTDGHKVGGPLELIDGMAYVAVEPPDTFIDAGYDKYLIKATRSWEKRQARRGSPADGSEAPKHGCHHDQPCCLCPEKENVVTVESERSVLVTTEISTLRAPDETFVDSVREILVLLSLLPVVGCRWHATSYMNARCRHSTSDLAEVYRRFHTRTDEAWRYHFHETISSAARKRSADYIAAHNGPVNTVLGRTGQNGPWGGTYEPRTGKYIIEPAERGILDDYRTKLDESRPRSAVETSPDQCGRCRQDDKRRSPAEHGRLPEYGRTLAEERIMPVDYGRIPIDERLPPIDYRHTPAEHKRTSGERSRLPGVQGYTESEYGQVPEKQSRNFGDYGNKVVDDQRFTPEGYGRSSTEQFGTPGEIARNFVDEVRAPVEYGLESGYPSREQVRTSLDNGYATMAQNSTPGEHVPQPDYGQVRTFSESGYPPEDKCCAPCEHERTPTDHERTPSDNRHLPMEHDRGPNEYIRTSLEQERAPIEYKRSPAEHARTSVEFGSPSVEQRRTQSGNERLSAEQVRSLDERNAPIKQNSISGEYRRTSGQNHALGEYRHPPGEQLRSSPEFYRSPGEQDGTPGEYRYPPNGQSHVPGVGPGGQGSTLGESGHTPVAQGRTAEEYKPPCGGSCRPGGHGQNSGECGRISVESTGPKQSEYGQTQGQQGRDRNRLSGEHGRIPSENGRTIGANARTPGNNARKSGERGRLPSERARISAVSRRYPGTNDQKRLSSEHKRTSGERGRTLGSCGRTADEQGRIPDEHERIQGEFETRTDDQPVILSDYFPSPEESGIKVREINEVLADDTVIRSNGPRMIEQQDRSGERGKRLNSNEGRIAGFGNRVSDQAHKTGDQQGKLSHHDCKNGGGGVLDTHRGIGNGGSLVVHPIRENEYISIPGQEPLTELDDEQEAYRDNNGGRRGELETKTGDLLTRLAANGARLSGGGGPSVAAGLPYVTESQQQNIRRSNMSSSLQNAPTADGKHRWSGATHSSMRRPSPNLVSPVPQRRSEDKKLVRTSREENRKTALKSPCRLSNGCAAPNVVGKQKSAPKYSCKRTAPQAFPTPATNFDQTVIKGKATSLTKIVSNHKGLTTDSTAVENIIGDKDIIVVSTNLFRNQESEIHSVKLDSSGKPVICHTKSSDETQTAIPNKPDSEVWIPVNEEVQTCSDPLGEEINMDRHEGSSRQEIRTSSKLKMSRPASGPRLNMVADDATPDENYIAIINKGDVVNLKVNIEVRSGESTNHNTSKKSHSLTNITRAEIGSQISIDEDMVVQSKSLQSLLNSEFRGTGFEGRPKVVVVQCACCGIRTLNPPRGDATPSENKKYFVLVPSSQHVNATVDKCDGGSSAKQTSDHPQSKRHGTSHPMNKTYSNTSIEAVTVRESPFPRREVGLFMATTNSSCQNSFGRNECPAPKPRVSITEDQGPRCNSVRRSTSQISVTQTGCVVSRNSNSNTNSRTRQNYSDATTQTEWCSVLLEARRHEDGRYSFHLPPLQVLRFYAFD
ncbi:uncharacterized protein LOC113492834 isoform X2 [Trichoplusia ni]|uniref:Uncharacterized protein LOC113492834 isoform X2 n=1 Tax=Trichoplusia ni TaxID=7111 RepID=A0A7E5VDI7_TRINI|nr:uncharacterized protein LOC113492834 isoform X2 [Trichoplusia ni]